jgi:hypothetical protein
VAAASEADLDKLDERGKEDGGGAAGAGSDGGDAKQADEKVEGVVPGSERVISLGNELRMLRQLGAAVTALEARFGDEKQLQLMVDRSERRLRSKMVKERAEMGAALFDERMQMGVAAARAVRAGERRALQQLRGRLQGLWIGFAQAALLSTEAMGAAGSILLLLFFGMQSQSAAAAETKKAPGAKKAGKKQR